MKNIKWNTIIFSLHAAYCLLFYVLFWNVFDNNELYWKYFDFAFACLHGTIGINTISQFIAMHKGKKFAVRWLFVGVFLWIMTITITTAQGI